VTKSALGPERYILSLALLAPLVIVVVGLGQLAGLTPHLPTTRVLAEPETPITSHRPVASEPAPPPTLAAPTATPQPTATPVPAIPPTAVSPPTPALAQHRTYTVQHGDQLKDIAAQYGVNIWKLIDANKIPNPDSLRVGQVLQIPDN